MKPTRNRNVIEAWSNGVTARSHNGNLRTSNGLLWSYMKLIGRTTKEGTTLLFDFTAPAGSFVSVTTSTHVNAAKPFASVIMNAKAAAKINLTTPAKAKDYEMDDIPF